jgi:MoaA/NifB/PqqE/SkfB family radical SAM enzyme
VSAPPQTLRLRGWLEGRPLLGPETVHLDIANACDSACITCWNHAPDLARPKSAEWKRQRMQPELFERLIDELAAAGVERIILSGGGEPFAHPEIDRFIDRVKEKGLRLTVITGGTRCDFARLAEQGVDQLLLNLASATSATYAAVHPGQPLATFERLVEGARRMAGRVNLVQVINRINFRELPAMVELAAEVGARCSFKVGDLPPGTERHALSTAERTLLSDELIPAARRLSHARSVKQNLDAFADQLAGQGRPGPVARCFAGYLYSRIGLDGTVHFCCAHVEVGSAAARPFNEVWSSEEYARLRQRIARGERFPACARCGKHDMNFAAARALEALRAQEELP